MPASLILYQFRVATVLTRWRRGTGPRGVRRSRFDERVPRVVKRISRSPSARARVVSDVAVPAPATLALDETLDLNAASRLRSSLLDRRGADLTLDASAVHHLGAQCAQVLASAVATWAADGAALTISAASEPFGQGVRLLGLHSILTAEGTRA